MEDFVTKYVHDGKLCVCFWSMDENGNCHDIQNWEVQRTPQ